MIISFISPFKINKVNPFPALTAPFPHIFLSNLFIAFEVKLPTNPSKLSLDKRTAMFAYAFFSKLPNHESKYSLDWIIVDIWPSLSLISVDILVAKAFLILVVSLVVWNNSYGNSSSSKFFLFNLNIVPVLYFAAAFTLVNCAFVNLTLDNLASFLILLHFFERVLISLV